MKKYSMGIFTGIAIGVSSMMFLGSSSINTGIDRYEYISGSTVDLKIFDKRTGKMYVRGKTLHLGHSQAGDPNFR